ncbi:MAG: hypothetical protein EOO88_29300 [Pedobacter sp.]|nr:MAG: hypothetical protein EOO88_29300 [Pedobacter sp.]
MGKAKQGIYGPMKGKVGQVVWYELNGQCIARGIGYRTAPRTEGEIESSKAHNLLTELFKPTQSFIKKGFGGLTKNTVHNYHNLAMSYNRSYAISADKQNPALRFDQLLFSNGDLLQPINPILEVVEHGLKISWDFSMDDYIGMNDRVMMLAYFPDNNQAIFETSGSKRSQLSDILLLNTSMRSLPMHVYIAFGAKDDERVSCSTYLGSVNI